MAYSETIEGFIEVRSTKDGGCHQGSRVSQTQPGRGTHELTAMTACRRLAPAQSGLNLSMKEGEMGMEYHH